MDFLTWLHDSAFGNWASQSPWGYPLVLTAHAIGMGIVVGAVLMFDLRVLGFAKRMSVRWFSRINTLTWAGFWLNAASGVCLFASDPKTFTFSRAFQLKMLLILAGGICAWVLARQLRDPQILTPEGNAAGAAKATALLSSLFWVGAIVAGRLIAYTT